MSGTHATAIERLLRACDIPNLFACWTWQGHTDGRSSQYGRFRGDNGQMLYTHRFAYEHFIGPIPPGMEVDHVCENTRCVNPSHLELQTPEQNKRLWHMRRAWDELDRVPDPLEDYA